MTTVSHITAIISDQDRAVSFYKGAFGCEVRGDQEFEFGGMKTRWVTVGFPGQDLEIVLSPPMQAAPGKAEPDPPGNGTMVVLAVDDCEAATAKAEAAGATISSPPDDMPWGRSSLVRDPDGNPYNLVQRPA